MKFSRLIISLIALCIGELASAQGFVYCASISDKDGKAVTGEKVTMDFDIRDGKGTTLYSERHADLVTDKNGAFSALVGTGAIKSGKFDKIAWEDAGLSVHIEYTRADGTKITDDQPIGVTPAALGADKASTLTTARKDGARYTLAVDDNGGLKTVRDDNEVITIPEGYSKMIFHDEFNGTGLPDSRYWGYEEGYVRGGEMQYYTVARPENVYQSDGLLHIVTLNDNWNDASGETHPVTSASVITKDKVKFTYGRVDIRAKIPICLGSWPALWMMPNDDVYGSWPNSGEIDIIEHVGFNPNTIYFTAHCAEQNGDHNEYHNSASVPTCTTEFHVYSFVWTENRLDWLVDGRRKWTVVKKSNTWRGWPYNKDFYLIMNTAFGGSWGGQRGVDLEALPITFDIDYVRVFQ